MKEKKIQEKSVAGNCSSACLAGFKPHITCAETPPPPPIPKEQKAHNIGQHILYHSPSLVSSLKSTNSLILYKALVVQYPRHICMVRARMPQVHTHVTHANTSVNTEHIIHCFIIVCRSSVYLIHYIYIYIYYMDVTSGVLEYIASCAALMFTR